jgi:hypothetical protein
MRNSFIKLLPLKTRILQILVFPLLMCLGAGLPRQTGLLFALTQPSSSQTASIDNVKIGAYYSPWYVSHDQDYFRINGTNTAVTMDMVLKNNRYNTYYFEQTNASSYMSNPAAYSNWFHSAYDEIANDYTVVPLDVRPEELETIYGSFDLPLTCPETPWSRLQGMVSLKQTWRAANLATPGSYPFVATNFAVFPNPLSENNGGFGTYEAENPDIVIQQKKLAVEYGIDYFTLEWYWSFDSSKNEMIDIKTAPLRTFFFETPPEGNLKLALNWIVTPNWNILSNPHAQDFSSNTVSTILEQTVPFFKNSQYLYLDGKPAFFIFFAETLIDLNTNYAERFQQLETEAQTVYGLPGITLIAIYCRPGYEPAFLNAGFDYVVNRSPAWYQCRNYDDYQSTLISVISNNNVRCSNIKTIPSLYMAHHPEDMAKFGSALYRQNRVLNEHGGDLWGNYRIESPALDVINGTNPSKFRNALNSIADYLDAQPQTEKPLLIWSWNNWLEGTALEPTTAYKYKFLDAIQEAASGNALDYDRPVLPPPSFRDDFNDNDANAWTLNGLGWDVFSEGLYVTNSSAGGLNASLTGSQYTNETIRCDLVLFSKTGLGWAGIHFRKTAQNDSPFQSGYVARMHDDGRLALYNVSSNLAVIQTGIDPTAETCRIEVETSENNIKVYLNGAKYIDVNDSTYSAGYPGTACSKAIVRFDNFEID